MARLGSKIQFIVYPVLEEPRHMRGHMTPQEVHAFLDSKPGWMMLSTIGRDGYPHSVPLGYFRLGDDLYLGCRAGTQKVKNIERNPQVSLTLETGSTMHDIKGVMIQGDAMVYTDAENLLRLRRGAERLRGVPEGEWSQEAPVGSAYIKVEPRRVVSWDYGREG